MSIPPAVNREFYDFMDTVLNTDPTPEAIVEAVEMFLDTHPELDVSNPFVPIA